MNNVTRLSRFSHRFDVKAVLYSFVPRLFFPFAQTDDDVHSTVPQVLGVSVPLIPVADDRHRFSVQVAHVCIVAVYTFAMFV